MVETVLERSPQQRNFLCYPYARAKPGRLVLSRSFGDKDSGKLDLSKHYFHSDHPVGGDRWFCLETDSESSLGYLPERLATFGLSALDHPWLGLESSALVTLSLISVWQNIGIPMMLFLAALIRIPEELVEAARVDGAGVWKIFWKIQFPLILPTVGIVAVLTFVGNFNAFELIYATQGALAGPNFASDILGTFFFRTFFGYQLQPADPFMGSAVAGIMLLIILTGVLIYLFGWQRRLQQIQF